MLEISSIVRKTENMFDLFNAHFYTGALTRPAITEYGGAILHHAAEPLYICGGKI